MQKHFLVWAVILLLVSSIGITAQEERLQIVASHSILGDVVSNVVGDAADLTTTMPVGADPHSFEPVPSDITALADADLVFINGAFFEEGLLEAIENADTDMNIVTVSSCVEIIAFGDGSYDHEEGDDHDDDHDHEEDEDHDHEHEDGEMSTIAELCEQHVAEMIAIHEADDDHDDDDDHDHEEDEDHDHEHGEMETLGFLYEADCGEGDHGDESDEGDEGDYHEHDHGACDPHVWMEPHNVMFWTMLIRDTLVELDPANADTYIANANAYIAELDEFIHDFVMPAVETVPEENRILITSHDSLGYFAARFDFEIVTTIIPGGSTLAEPSAGDIAAVIDLINEEGVSAIFGETTVNDAIAQTIADETGAELYILYSGSLSDANGPASTYLDYMRYNVTTIVTALGGSAE